MRFASRLWGAVAIVAAAGCAKSALGPWTAAADPPTPGALDLSIFESSYDGASCRWVRVDPISGGRQPLLWLPSECGSDHVVWSPDGRLAAVADAGGDQPTLHEVSLVDGATRAIDPPPGDILSLFYREGRLYVVVSPKPQPSLLDRLLRRTPPSPEGNETFALDGRWKKVDVEPPDSAIAMRLDSQEMPGEPLPAMSPAPKKIDAELAEQYGGDGWKVLGPDLYLAPPSQDGAIVHRLADGKYEDIGNAGYSSDEDSTASGMQVRGHWALLTYEGSSPQLIDLDDGGRTVYRAPDGSSGTFWPR